MNRPPDTPLQGEALKERVARELWRESGWESTWDEAIRDSVLKHPVANARAAADRIISIVSAPLTVAPEPVAWMVELQDKFGAWRYHDSMQFREAAEHLRRWWEDPDGRGKHGPVCPARVVPLVPAVGTAETKEEEA